MLLVVKWVVKLPLKDFKGMKPIEKCFTFFNKLQSPIQMVEIRIGYHIILEGQIRIKSRNFACYIFQYGDC